jgi:cytochrome oxidase assembly protein ShyY1
MPGPLDVHLKDGHMQYAITWFALPRAVVIAFAVWWQAQRRASSPRGGGRLTEASACGGSLL